MGGLSHAGRLLALGIGGEAINQSSSASMPADFAPQHEGERNSSRGAVYKVLSATAQCLAVVCLER